MKSSKKRSNKQTIAQHEEVLKNLNEYYEQLHNQFKETWDIMDQVYYRIRVIVAQIEKAKLEGKDSFDRETYKVNVKR